MTSPIRDTDTQNPAAPVSTAENPLPCPVPSPEGLPCTKKIPVGWTADEGHGGGHFWIAPKVSAILNGGHYDATAALSGAPFDGHLPEDCPGDSCPYSAYLSAKSCCGSHNQHCEPPSELCCHHCAERAHDTFPIRHADGSRCVLDAAKEAR